MSDDSSDGADLSGPGPSSVHSFSAEDLVETHLEEENSRLSSNGDPLSPSAPEYSDEDDSDISSDS